MKIQSQSQMKLLKSTPIAPSGEMEIPQKFR